MERKSGYAAILGLPNAGKSTLMNSLLGQKLSIVTSKPQTTRKNILGILTGENYQLIFLDTPGILKPAYLLQKRMLEAVEESVRDADVLVFISDIADDPDGSKLLQNEFVSRVISMHNKPVILLLNKVDLAAEVKIIPLVRKFESLRKFDKVIPVSALQNLNLHLVLTEIINFLPVHPYYYPEDIAAAENERFFVSEIIREKIFELYKEEVPYSTEVAVIEFLEREEKKSFIQAEIYVEKESQKGIIIGKNGTAIKNLGEKSRESIEEFLQKPVFLELRCKVKSKWRSDEKMLSMFGYSADKR